jgi:hypothetical protein
MIDAIPLILMGAWVFAGMGWFFQSQRLFKLFRGRYPEEADLKMQHAFDFYAHPSKLLYFYSRDCAAFLRERNDRSLLVMRRSVIRWSVAVLVVFISPLLGVATLLVLHLS